MSINLTLPLSESDRESLKARDTVYITGEIYTARDAAHKRIVEIIQRGEKLPFELQGAIIYYAGPSPAAAGRVTGSCGPTTASRMNAYAPTLYENGMSGVIGKGNISDDVIEAMKRNKGVYFAATGGAGALIARSIKDAEIVAFPELGAEAVRRLYVESFPAIVGVDSRGEQAFWRAEK